MQRCLTMLTPLLFALTAMTNTVALGQLHGTDEKRTAQYKDAPKEDMEAIQGLWVRTFRAGLLSTARATKEIKGDRETVTYYTSGGEVASAHSVKIKLHRAGPIKVFTFSDYKYVEGPNKGQSMEGSYEYVYKIVGDTFVEISGVLGDTDADVSTLKWKREKQETGG